MQASRATRFELSERLRDVHVAIECLCEEEPGSSRAFDRWEKLAERYGIWAEVAKRGYDRAEIEALQARLKSARNVVTHGADAVLVDLGYPVGANRPTRGTTVAGEDLAFSGLQADLSPLIFAVRYAIRQLFGYVRGHDWDDNAFDSQFTWPAAMPR